MSRAWRTTVRTGLRRQHLSDLHDFLDVHRNLKPYLKSLRSEVLSGQYRPAPPEIALLEKRKEFLGDWFCRLRQTLFFSRLSSMS